MPNVPPMLQYFITGAGIVAAVGVSVKWAPRVGIPDIPALKSAADTPGLLRALRHKDATVRSAAASALGELSVYQALRPLMNALQDRQPEVRRAAALALGELRDERAAQSLMTAANTDANSQVREAAQSALARLKTR